MRKYIFFLIFALIPSFLFGQGFQLANNAKFTGSNCVYLVLSGSSGGLSLASGSSVAGTNLKITGNLANAGTVDIATCDVVFNGTASQAVSGAGTTIFDTWNFNNSANGSLSGLVQIRKMLTLTNGNIASNGNLKLLSDASNTAMVINTNGSVTGNATQQRYIDGTYNGTGYHYLSPPVQSANINSVFGSKMNLVCNTAFNAATEPAQTSPFPTFYQYDETKAGTPRGSGTGLYDAFMAGWQVPNSSDNMAVMKGYSANIAKGQTLDFTGVLNNGALNVALTNGDASKSYRGWNLVGNPYPSPIAWSAVLAMSSNVDNAVYQRIATGQYSGTWASYIAGVGTNGGTNKIAIGQAFLVRCSNNAGGSLVMNNTVRSTAYENPAFSYRRY
jgi:trimeric autotransporter adhesin